MTCVYEVFGVWVLKSGDESAGWLRDEKGRK